MKYRRFGKTDLTVSEIGFGCLRLAGTSVERKSQNEVLNTLAEALDSGVNFYDTADAYGQGRSEEILGKALRGRRNKVIVATKAGYCLSRFGSFAARLKPYVRPLVRAFPSVRQAVTQIRGSEVGQDFSPRFLSSAIDQSLVRLHTDYIDLFQLHNPPASALESGEFLEALERAKAAGKIRWYGVSCRAVEDASLCFRHAGVVAIQVEINLPKIRACASVVPEAHKQNIAVIAREPFASGSLLSNGLKPSDQFGADLHATAQSALQTVLGIAGVSAVIVGMSSRVHLRENLRALEIR